MARRCMTTEWSAAGITSVGRGVLSVVGEFDDLVALARELGIDVLAAAPSPSKKGQPGLEDLPFLLGKGGCPSFIGQLDDLVALTRELWIDVLAVIGP